MTLITNTIATELSATPKQVQAAIQLLDDGNTVPFIARYRKEATEGLDDTQLRTLAERLCYLRELEERKASIIKSIESQGKLTKELHDLILAAEHKARLEDLYRPYKPKRHTKGQIAIEAGLQPLADKLFQDPTLEPQILAQDFINQEKGIIDVQAALDGARYILMEQFADDAELNGKLREKLWQEGLIVSKLVKGKESEAKKFTDYFDFSEKISSIPSHRALAILRGRHDEFLQLQIESNESCDNIIAEHFSIKNLNRPADPWLLEVVRWTWQAKLRVSLEVDLIARMRELAETQAIKVFSHNLKDLLMAPPAGAKITMGLDPGLRTGVKVVIVDVTGKLLEHYTIYPHVPQNQWQASIEAIAKSCQQHKVQLISIGNGTGSRETDNLVADLIKQYPTLDLTKMITSEAGASVYSASELAAKEFPDLDVSLRGAVSIARRLQDPLAELVKIDPKSIGVGQYQHDVNQPQLARTLDTVVEDCVNLVGVDINTASQQLLANVAGLNQSTASNIVNYRNQNGPFSSRENLKKVPRFGEKSFEQAAGFLRIANGENPLDASGVHPETYSIVQAILAKTNLNIKELIGNKSVLDGLKPTEFTTEQFGLPTVNDVIAELYKPGRDPRPQFKSVQFKQDVTDIKDLKIGMLLEGIVTNVADFGAFVDIGVHQDGLVHISAMSNKFITDPREIAKTGDTVKVKVINIDTERKRISLSMKLSEPIENKTSPKNEQLQGKPAKDRTRNNPGKFNAVVKSPSKKEIASPFGDMLKNALNEAKMK